MVSEMIDSGCNRMVRDMKCRQIQKYRHRRAVWQQRNSPL